MGNRVSVRVLANVRAAVVQKVRARPPPAVPCKVDVPPMRRNNYSRGGMVQEW